MDAMSWGTTDPTAQTVGIKWQPPTGTKILNKVEDQANQMEIRVEGEDVGEVELPEYMDEDVVDKRMWPMRNLPWLARQMKEQLYTR